MGKGKYKKILAKNALTYDDLLVLAAGKKIKGIFGSFVAIRHDGEDYLKIINSETFKHLLEKNYTRTEENQD